MGYAMATTKGQFSVWNPSSRVYQHFQPNNLWFGIQAYLNGHLMIFMSFQKKKERIGDNCVIFPLADTSRDLCSIKSSGLTWKRYTSVVFLESKFWGCLFYSILSRRLPSGKHIFSSFRPIHPRIFTCWQ